MNSGREKISIIVPCYNEEKSLPFFYEAIMDVINTINYDFEVIFVNDGSKDNTINIIKGFASVNNIIKYINFSRNFGKEAAMYAGLEKSSGDYVVIMDADLQHPPRLIKEMINILENDETIDCAASRRVTRTGEPKIRSFFARKFYKIINKISQIDMVDGAQDYRLMRRQMVNAILELKEVNRYSKGIFPYVGFNTKWIEIENEQRVAGETSWSFWKLFLYAIEGIVSFSTFPLVFSALVGIILCLISFVMFCIIIVKSLIFSEPSGLKFGLICAIFMISGIQLFCMGIIGEYLAKTYLETKKRPIYIVKETNIDEN